MNIYIDESGTFVHSPSLDSWNAVAAVAVPESGRKKLDLLVRALRTRSYTSYSREVKLKDIPIDHYIQFLENLEKLNVVVFCTATDMGLITKETIAKHLQSQVNGILVHIDKMKFKDGEIGIELLASHLRKLSLQLYVQLICQINLMFDVINRSITYFAQHNPITLQEFRWRIDEKNRASPNFEEVFEKLSPAFLQTRSIEEPLLKIQNFNYSFMTQYELPKGKPPEYLKDDYGIEVDHGFDVQKLIRGNIRFLDSKESTGIQASDIIVSGIRRCLRGGFSNNEIVATKLGKLMLQAAHNGPSLNLVTFGDEAPLQTETANVVRLMSINSRRMIK
jgi:hypothetical protein